MKVLFCLNECNHLIRMPPHRAWEGSYCIIMNSHTVAYMDLTFIIRLAANLLPPELNTSYLIDLSAPQCKLPGTERCRTKCKSDSVTMPTSSNQQWNFWAKHKRKVMVIQSQQNGEKIARALNSHLPAVWRERLHSSSEGTVTFHRITGRSTVLPCEMPTPDQAIQHTQTQPCAQL